MKYIVDMPEWWSCCKNGELNCEWCDTEYGCPKDCALATAKKAVKLNGNPVAIEKSNVAGYVVSLNCLIGPMANEQIGGKDVTLYAVEDK